MEDREKMIDSLARLIIKRGALKFGDFTLSSGKKSDYYIDGRIIALTPEGASLIGRIIHSMLIEKYPEARAVGGLIAGAVPVASAVAQASFGTDRPIDAFMVRKETKKHGTQKMVEGPVAPGTKVVVVDDVITTGGSTIEAIERAEEFGCEVLGIICIVDREDTKDERFGKYPYSPVLTISKLREYKDKV